MRDNLFTRYTPKLISELKKGDKVWIVSGITVPIYLEAKVLEIIKGDKSVLVKYEPSLEKQYPYTWCYVPSWYVESSYTPEKSVKIKGRYGNFLYSDYTVLKHSILHKTKKLEKKYRCKIKELQEKLENIKKVRESF
jgi:hypothetical protein